MITDETITWTDREIEELIQRFETGALGKGEWSHAAHLAMAVSYLWCMPYESALDRSRTYLLRFLASIGIENSDTEGYHESVTRVWLMIVDRFLRAGKYASVSQAFNTLLRSEESTADYPLNFYQKETLFSVAARRDWVIPDLPAGRELVAQYPQ